SDADAEPSDRVGSGRDRLPQSCLEVTGMHIRLMSFALVIFGFTAAGAAGDKLSVRVSPTVAFAPANLTIRTMVEADPDNHAVRISAESPDFYRSSEVGLEGEDAPRTTT